jgi:hypothetical protein
MSYVCAVDRLPAHRRPALVVSFTNNCLLVQMKHSWLSSLLISYLLVFLAFFFSSPSCGRILRCAGLWSPTPLGPSCAVQVRGDYRYALTSFCCRSGFGAVVYVVAPGRQPRNTVAGLTSHFFWNVGGRENEKLVVPFRGGGGFCGISLKPTNRCV